jgi:hypothetical protein
MFTFFLLNVTKNDRLEKVKEMHNTGSEKSSFFRIFAVLFITVPSLIYPPISIAITNPKYKESGHRVEREWTQYTPTLHAARRIKPSF